VSKPGGARRPQGQARGRQSSSFWRGPWPIVGTLAGIVLLVVAFILISRSQGSPPAATNPNPTADPTVVTELTHVSSAVSDAVGTGGAANPLTRTTTGTLLRGPDGKPEFLYIGAEWCPFCAAERWSMLVALSRFGTFHGLHFTTSSSADVFPNTPTLSFTDSTYQGAYLDFDPADIENRDHKPLRALSPQETQVWQTYDAAGDIPFLDIANRYTAVGQGVPASLLQGMTWRQIAGALSNPNSPVTRAIVGNANYLTAAICKILEPADVAAAPVCSSATITQIAAQLPG
jgi:thiol-disulfide isomerase/thioredoxin